jgi:hypothetical protein
LNVPEEVLEEVIHALSEAVVQAQALLSWLEAAPEG